MSAALERALVRELLVTWKQINESYFKSALTPPAIELVPTRGHLGRWMRETRTIEISRPLVLEKPWLVVVEVMKHEVAHQYVHEVVRGIDEAAHGPVFKDVCARLGIDARAAGLPEAPAAAPTDESEREARIIERIGKLLALAESPNENEAQAATAAAQRLMLKYNLEASSERRDYGFRHLGAPSGRVTESERILAMILGKHFFVEVIWVPVYRPHDGKRGSVLEICGTRANLAIAEYVHVFLTETSERLWREHKAMEGIWSNRDRRTYLAGVMAGFHEKLARESTVNKEAGLVWVRDGDLYGFLKKRHPYIRHVRHAGQQKNEAYARGKEAGRKIVLRRGVEAQAESRGRLLKA